MKFSQNEKFYNIVQWCLSIYYKTSIIHYSKINGSLTRETRLKVAVNMEDLTCLLETVRTLKPRPFFGALLISRELELVTKLLKKLKIQI